MKYLLQVGTQYIIKKPRGLLSRNPGVNDYTLTSNSKNASHFSTRAVAEAFASDVREQAYHYGNELIVKIIRIGEG